MSKKELILKLKTKSCLLVPITEQEYTQYRKHSIPINENSTGYLSFMDSIEKVFPHIDYPHYYMALKSLFRESGSFYDSYKCSFGYMFLLKIIDDKSDAIYTLNFTDVKGGFSFYFRKVLSTPKEFIDYADIPKDLLHQPFDEFSKDDISEFMTSFITHLVQFINAHEQSYNEEFVRYLEYCFLIYGYRDGKFFVKHYESYDEFYKEKKRDEEDYSKQKCLESRVFLDELQKSISLKTKGFRFNRDEANER